jgi:hypothetical protein
MNRYIGAPVINLGTARGTSNAVHNVRVGVSSGTIRFTTRVLQESQRLDMIAGLEYGDSSLWWAIAAASNIGWSLQVPPGTLLRIPNMQDVARVI